VQRLAGWPILQGRCTSGEAGFFMIITRAACTGRICACALCAAKRRRESWRT
jgi:hypothetical protein